MPTFFMTIRGDQLGTYTGLSGTGNGAARVVTLTGTTPYGTRDQLFTIRVDQAATGATEFANGQLVTIFDASGGVVMPQSGVQPDIEQGLGAGDEHLILSQRGFLIDLTGVQSGSMVYRRSDDIADSGRGDNDGNLDFADTRASFPCFASGSLIQTPQGPRPVESLRAGDVLSGVDGGSHTVLWTGARRLTLAALDHPQRPVLFRPGSLGPGQPQRDLLVSPQHTIQVQHPRLGPVLVPAKALTDWPGVRPALGLRHVTYHALLLTAHAVIVANGAAVESLYPGRHILGLLPLLQRMSLLTACPALLRDPDHGYGPPARLRLTVQQGRRLLHPRTDLTADHRSAA